MWTVLCSLQDFDWSSTLATIEGKKRFRINAAARLEPLALSLEKFEDWVLFLKCRTNVAGGLEKVDMLGRGEAGSKKSS